MVNHSYHVHHGIINAHDINSGALLIIMSAALCALCARKFFWQRAIIMFGKSTLYRIRAHNTAAFLS